MTESDAIHGREQAPARDAPLCKNCRYIFGHWYRRPHLRDLPLADTWYPSEIRCTPHQLLRNARTCPSCYLLLSKNPETVARIVRSDPIGSYEVNLLQKLIVHGTTVDTHAVALRFETSSDHLCLMYSVQGARGKCPHDQTNFLCSSKVL